MGPILTIARKALALSLCPLLWNGVLVAQERNGLQIVVVEGEGAIHNIRSATAMELRVRLQTADGKPVARIPVTFVLPNGGAGGTFPDGSNTQVVLSDSSGHAGARGFRPNGIAGQFPVRVSATFRGETARATVTQTNAVPEKGRPFGRTVLKVALIGGAVFGAALIASAILNSNGTERREDTPFGSSR